MTPHQLAEAAEGAGIRRDAQVRVQERHRPGHHVSPELGQVLVLHVLQLDQVARAPEAVHRLPAQACAEPADAVRIDARAVSGMGEKRVEQRLQRRRAHELHLDELVDLREDGKEIVEVLDADLREAPVAVEHGGDHEAPGGEIDHRVDVPRAEGAAAEPVREENERQARGPVRQGRIHGDSEALRVFGRADELRRRAGELHAGNAVAGAREGVIGIRVRLRGGMADDRDVGHALAGEARVGLAKVRHLGPELQCRLRRGEDLRDVAPLPVARPPFPDLLRRPAG